MPADDGQPGRAVYVKRARALGFLNDPNDFAQAMVAIIPLLFLAWRPSAWTRNLFVVLIPASVFVWGILLTRSRGGLLALVLLLPMARLLRMRPRARHVTMTALAVAAVPFFILLFRYALSDESAMGRIEAWSAGLQMLKASPVWGVGSGFFMDHHLRVAHSSLVQCFAETGLVGYFLWLAFVVLSLDLMARLAESSTDVGWIHWARCVQLSLLGFLGAPCSFRGRRARCSS
jgi:O-antigen ligase